MFNFQNLEYNVNYNIKGVIMIMLFNITTEISNWPSIQWENVIITGLVALIGSVIGAGLAYLFSKKLAKDERKFREEDTLKSLKAQQEINDTIISSNLRVQAVTTCKEDILNLLKSFQECCKDNIQYIDRKLQQKEKIIGEGYQLIVNSRLSFGFSVQLVQDIQTVEHTYRQLINKLDRFQAMMQDFNHLESDDIKEFLAALDMFQSDKHIQEIEDDCQIIVQELNKELMKFIKV